MAVVLGVVGLFSAAGRASGLDGQPGWEWTRLQPPTGIAEWGLLMVYCAGVLSGQLAMAAGYARVRAGKAAFIALSELAFACACHPPPAHPPPARPARCRPDAPVQMAGRARAAAAAPSVQATPVCSQARVATPAAAAMRPPTRPYGRLPPLY